MKSFKNISLEKLKVRDLQEIIDKLAEDDLIFRCNHEQLAKHFLNKVLSLNPFQVDFEALKNAYLANIEFDKFKKKEDENELNTYIREKRKQEIEEVIKDENEFYKYICKTYLNLTKVPKEELLKNYEDARKDLIEIDKTLENITRKLDEIERNNDVKEKQKQSPILKYYKEHNQNAKKEIINFLKNDIRSYSLNKCHNDTLLSFQLGSVPYKYKWNPKSYIPRYPGDIENKFADLPFPKFRELYKKYQNNKDAFRSYVTLYIKENNIVDQIKNSLSKHHILHYKKEIISEALDAYSNGAVIMFANAVPNIIEGILHDICLLSGEDNNVLLQQGFQYKLDKLHSIFKHELFYEYYAFRFRLFRNKVAHGRIGNNDINEIPDLLLLDLNHICKLVQSNKLKLNKKRSVISKLNDNSSEIDYNLVITYLLLDEIDIPSFYELEEQISEVEKLISSEEFWNYLEKEIDSGGENAKHGIYKVLKIVTKKYENCNNCIKLFRKLSIREYNQKFADNYLKHFLNDF